MQRDTNQTMVDLGHAARCAIFGLLCLWMVSPAQAQLVVSDSGVGYIDSAVLATQFRVRFDAGYNSIFADRVEFQYAKYNDPGLPLVETAIDSHQELSAYVEWAPFELLSVFADVPLRWINPEINDNTGGLYDINAGAKLALYETDRSLLTAQLRTYIPTGDIDAGLSAGHVSLEPSLLCLTKLSRRLTLETEIRDWIPIDASTTGPGGSGGGGGGGGGGMGPGGRREFGGNVLRWGAGLTYLACDSPGFTVSPVTELVGWHVFSGLKSDTAGQRISAQNDAIVNAKFGLRLGRKKCGLDCRPSDTIFIGYGTALTDEIWYSDILRVEMRWAF